MVPGGSHHHSEGCCLLYSYLCRAIGTGQTLVTKTGLDSPLTELGLIKASGRRDEFQLRARAETFSRPRRFLLRCDRLLESLFQHYANTLSFEALNHEPGSPGRVFLLEENDIVDMLVALEEVS